MATFLAELKRRNIYRVGAAYAVVAWVLLQLTANVAPILDLPPWIARTVLMLLVMGLPIALVLAWTVETKSPAMGTTTKMDFVLAGALFVVIALVSYEQLAPSRTANTTQEQLTGVAAARTSSLSPTGAISIAVLPFANLSSDPEQEFFSDGITEEITAALAKVSALVVIGRTSAFEYKGQNKDLRMIGQALGTTHLIEGSVRKAGNRVRITAQLIRADNGAHLWTENYDRELTDIFAVQEDIAEAIATALRVPLGLAQGEKLVRSRTGDPESYDQYLRAKALVRARGFKSLTDAAVLLERVVARDPDFAPAWALLAQVYGVMPAFHPAGLSGSAEALRGAVDASLPRAEAAARRAIQLDPRNADGYVSLGYVQAVRGKILLAEDLFKQALALDPNTPDALHWDAGLVATVGRPKESLVIRRRLQALEPFVPIFDANLAQALWLNGQNEAAIAMYEVLRPARQFSSIGLYAGMGYAAMGRYSEAADALQEIPSGIYPPGMVEAAARLLRTAPRTVTAPQTLPRLGTLGFVFLHVGAPGRALEFYESNVEAGYSDFARMGLLWHPSYAPVRKTERFKTFIRKAGLVEYWRAKGWPEFCHPTSGDDFACA
jgi:TolB-like protein